jgi:flagellar biosynthesis repressor protein FlbT
MLIHLKKNEKLYINGAVIRLEHRGTIELMNDAHFLLENHILQADSASTPLRQLYFIIQIMLMDPSNAYLTMQLFKSHVGQLRANTISKDYFNVIDSAETKVDSGNYFEAMRYIRQNFSIEERILEVKARPRGNSLEAA